MYSIDEGITSKNIVLRVYNNEIIVTHNTATDRKVYYKHARTIKKIHDNVLGEMLFEERVNSLVFTSYGIFVPPDTDYGWVFSTVNCISPINWLPYYIPMHITDTFDGYMIMNYYSCIMCNSQSVCRIIDNRGAFYLSRDFTQAHVTSFNVNCEIRTDSDEWKNMCKAHFGDIVIDSYDKAVRVFYWLSQFKENYAYMVADVIYSIEDIAKEIINVVYDAIYMSSDEYAYSDVDIITVRDEN